METVRIAKQTDKTAYRKLWKTCFGDSDAFCEWFFENRFVPNHCVCLETDGQFAACMQAFPYTIGIREKAVKGVMLCGVCTHPTHRKKGYMNQVFRYEMDLLRQKGYAIAVHTPAVLESYFSFGHYPVADACYLTTEQIPQVQPQNNVFAVTYKQWEMLYDGYVAFAKKYSGMIWRSKDDFFRKCQDYSADGGMCKAYQNENCFGYVFYYQTKTEVTCVEAVGDDAAIQIVLQEILSQAEGLSFSAKLRPKTNVAFDFCKKEVKQKGVMGLVCVEMLLQILGLQSEASFVVQDDVVAENNGCFTLDGKRSDKKPAFTIEAGRLLQVLVGYVSLQDLQEEIVVHDAKGFAEIANALPMVDCYIVDEY